MIGLLFMLLGLVVMPAILLNIMHKLTEPYERYNYEEIIGKGHVQNAKITWIERNYTTRIKGTNPRIISYMYVENGIMKKDRFQTLDVAKLETLRIADSITVSVLNNESVINDIKPFSFPFQYLWLAPLIFLLLGWMMYSSAHKAGMQQVQESSHA